MEGIITTLTDVKINKGTSNIKIKTYYHDFESLPNTVLAFVNNIPNYSFDSIPFKVCELGMKMINHPLLIDFNVNKSGELIVSGLNQSDLDEYSLGGTDGIDLTYNLP